MALGQFGAAQGGGGDFAKRIEYNAKAGRFYRVERIESGGQFETQKVEIRETDFSAVFDMGNIEVGWAHYPAGSAPSFAFARLGDPIPARPSEHHKQAFRVKLVLGTAAAGDGDRVRDFTSSANGTRGAMDALHDAYLAAKDANPGKLPVVKVDRVVPVTNKHGTNYDPIFAISGWAPRPASLDGGQDQQDASPPATTPPATGRVTPTPQPAAVADDDFG